MPDLPFKNAHIFKSKGLFNDHLSHSRLLIQVRG